MKIAEIDFVALSVPVKAGKAYGMSKLIAAGRQSTLVRLRLEDGTEGFGEAWGPPEFNLAYLKFLSGYLVGCDVFDIEHAYDRVLARHYHFGMQNALMTAISGVDMAAKDAAGKVLALPVCRLIGGRRIEQVPIYASGGYLTYTPDEDFPPQIEVMAKAGYADVKIKIGVSPQSDADRLAKARSILGDHVRVAVDINSNYTADVARCAIDAMAPYRPEWVEEPVSPRDLAGLGRVKAASPFPIATGEALFTVHDFAMVADSADILQPDLSLCGGFWQGRKIAELAHARHLRLSPHVWGGAMGLAAAVQFIASLSVYPHSDNVPKPVLLEYDLGENPLRSELVRNPMVPKEGIIAVPEEPGLGIEIDMDAVERYAVKH